MNLSFLGGVDLQALLQRVERRAEMEAVLALLQADQAVCAGVRSLLSCFQHCRLLETLYVRTSGHRSAYCLAAAPVLHAAVGRAQQRLPVLSTYLSAQLRAMGAAALHLKTQTQTQTQTQTGVEAGSAALCLQLVQRAQQGMALARRQGSLRDFHALQGLLQGAVGGGAEGSSDTVGGACSSGSGGSSSRGGGNVWQEEEEEEEEEAAGEREGGRARKRQRVALAEVAVAPSPSQHSLSPSQSQSQSQSSLRVENRQPPHPRPDSQLSSPHSTQQSLPGNDEGGKDKDRDKDRDWDEPCSTTCHASSAATGYDYGGFSNSGSSQEVDISHTI